MMSAAFVEESLKRKRSRGDNYCSREVEDLLTICNSYNCILENKKTDLVSNSQKVSCWQEIEQKFNKSSVSVFRKKESLQSKYESVKKMLRKRAALQKAHVMGTGGGEYLKLKPLSEQEEILYANIKLSAEGLPNWYGMDSSAVVGINNEYSNNEANNRYAEEHVDNDLHELESSQDTETNVVVDWAEFSAPMLQTRKSPQLQLNNGLTHSQQSNTLPRSQTSNLSQNINHVEPVIVVASTSAAVVQSSQMTNHNVSNGTPAAAVSGNLPAATANGIQARTTVTPNPPANTLNVIRKKRTPHKNVKSKPFEELAVKKLKLIERELELSDLKKTHLQEEHEWKRQKFTIECEILKKQLES
ncbi:uncharacterized protein LOC135841076 [Planococcus citri]|uniref:uncharacterized protein LOC135841076 n=1 Tax=Planococcus citri TaxID=170843 RepID=UPI0031F8762D